MTDFTIKDDKHSGDFTVVQDAPFNKETVKRAGDAFLVVINQDDAPFREKFDEAILAALTASAVTDR